MNNAVKSNVVKLKNSVYEQVKRFLRDYSQDSKNTAVAYENDVRQFFLQEKKKELEFLTREDLKITIEEFEDYKYYLLNVLKRSPSTVNRHIIAITELFRHLYKRGLVQDISFLEIKRPVATSNSYDGFTHDEILKVASFIKTTGRVKTGLIKKMLVLYSYDTCSRKEECLNLKWSDFGSKNERGMIPVRTIAKGNKIMNREISTELYNHLLSIKEKDKEKVFNIGSTTVERMMNDIRDFLNIDTEYRNIVFHSIRKAGAQFIWEKTRDLNQVSKALGHASIKTTELYINKNEEYGVVGAISSTNSANDNLYNEVDHNTLKKAIKKMNKSQQLFINIKIKELINDFTEESN